MKKAHVLFFLFLIINTSFAHSLNFVSLNPEISLKYPPKVNSFLYSSSTSEVDYLIITTTEFVSALTDFQNWKQQKGLHTQIVTIDEIQTNHSGIDLQAKIKNCIQAFYENNGTRWVLLAGDDEQVPSRSLKTAEEHPGHDEGNVSCDSYYADLDHNWDSNNDGLWATNLDDFDLIPEVYVGRLTANNIEEMQKLVSNILGYEKIPPLGDWMTRALLAGAMLVFNEDWDNDNQIDFGECDANRHYNFLSQQFPTNWSYILQAEAEGLSPSQYAYNESLTITHLENQINDGNGIVFITGHGNQKGMYRTIFTEDVDDDGLFDQNGDPLFGGAAIDTQITSPLISTSITTINPSRTLGMYYLGGCSTGTFDEDYDSLAEYVLKTSAIGCIAGSHVVWGEDQWTERDHGGWYSEGLQSRFLENLVMFSQPGKALGLAKQDYIADLQELNITLDYPGWSDRVLKQFNLLGDPELNIWMEIPSTLNATRISTTNSSPQIYSLTSEGIPVPNVTFTVFQNETLIWTGYSSEDGFVEIPFPSEDLATSILTGTKSGYLPCQNPFIYPKNISITDYDPNPPNNNDNSSDDGLPEIPRKINGYQTIYLAISFAGITGVIYIIKSKKFGRN
ncbi:hypothetical protein NEF87_002917 [Candidatus Lokiarchaeum ossiferum]|uniref:Gingipain domain-containing protein n=1 Tax=Candidatus Lokiarchaeum ossiferum TaxID=2951803 RepID=A0ABY6HUU3_9ARCH|nr:hypothetical protein NEF87_002917 [Candidatus Lokiarchaeum sp. B-35]